MGSDAVMERIAERSPGLKLRITSAIYLPPEEKMRLKRSRQCL
jgi:hypothetical protein